MKTPAPFVIVQDGQRVSRDTFATKAEADKAANKINEPLLKESTSAQPKKLVESKQILNG